MRKNQLRSLPESNPKRPATGDATATEQKLLDRFIELFLHESSNPDFENAAIEMLEGLSAANRSDLIPEALPRLSGATHQPNLLARAVAVAILRLAGDSESVQVLVDEAQKLFGPDSDQPAETLVLLGDAMYVAELPDLAVPYYRKAIERSPANIDALNNLAIVLTECDPSNEESRKLVEQVVGMEPENAERRDTMLVIAIAAGGLEDGGQDRGQPGFGIHWHHPDCTVPICDSSGELERGARII